MSGYASKKKQLNARLLQKIDMSRETSDEEICGLIDELLVNESKESYISLDERELLQKELFYSIRKLDILQELIDDSTVTEIMVNGPGHIFVERAGRLAEWRHSFDSAEKLEDIIQQIVARTNRIVNEASPIVDTRLENGARVNVVLPPVALNGPILTIRRFPDKPVTMEDLLRWNSVSAEAAAFLKLLVQAGYNIFISGGTGSGKTTFLNALSQFIPSEERIITIEDSAELQILDKPNLVRLETRNATIEGGHEISIRDLIRSSLRMRPDRIIVGEVRGGEAIDMMQAFNTGHDGSLSTGHANSSRDMLSRLETMILMGMEIPLAAIRSQIASGIDIIVHLGRLRDKSRKVLEIVEIVGCTAEEVKTAALFRFVETGEGGDGIVEGRLEKTGELLRRQKLDMAGLRLKSGG